MFTAWEKVEVGFLLTMGIYLVPIGGMFWPGQGFNATAFFEVKRAFKAQYKNYKALIRIVKWIEA